MITDPQIYEETMSLYWERGIKFTMDELAARLCISKKTLYTLTPSKEALTIQVIEYYFDKVAEIQDQIHADVSLNPLEKLKKLLCATPDFPLRRVQLHDLKMTFPIAFKVFNDKLRLGWERTFAVMNQAKQQGLIKDIDNVFFSQMYAALIEEIINSDSPDDGLTYRQKQEQAVDLLLFGLCTA